MAYIGFKALAAKTSPALAAYIGRKKYGEDKMRRAASTGKSLRNDPINKKVSTSRPPLGNRARYNDALDALSRKKR